MKTIDLNGIWQGECVNKFTFDGQVPGSTINDLVNAGKLPKDLLAGFNADKVIEYETADWVYRKKVNVSVNAFKYILKFERLDTFADLYINGNFVAHSENGNIEVSFDVTDHIRIGENDIELKLYSCVTSAKPVPEDVPYAFTRERLNIRRQQCTFSWDWVARFVGCSIGKTSLVLIEKDEVIVDSVYVYTKHIDSDGASVGVSVDFKNKYSGRLLRFEVQSPSGEIVYARDRYCDFSSLRFSFDLKNPELWYPTGYGKQPIYTLIIKDGDKVLTTETFGVRIVRVLQLPDEKDSKNYDKCLSIKNPKYDFNDEFSGFILKVNGIKIFCKGANWVPCQPYEMSGKEERIVEILQRARDFGVNMIRIWGGGSFECKEFYDTCSRLGLLVTQDFLMACALYPEKEEWFIDQLLLETEYAVKLIRNQPCLMWWSGDNENAVEGSDIQDDYRGRDAFYKGIEPIISKYDPYRDAFASSPYGGNVYASNTVGTTHHTQFMGDILAGAVYDKSLANYKERFKKKIARFIAEEPIFSAISLSSIRKFMTDEEIFTDDLTAWLYHCKGNPTMNIELMDGFLHFAEKILGEFKNPQDRYFKFKYIGYEWVRVVLEQARREKWFCSGMIFWMLNECWTASAGWSIFDYYNKPKLCAYSFKRCAKEILASLDCNDGDYSLTISNDGLSIANCSVKLYKVCKNNTKQISEFELTVDANSNTVKELDVKCNDNEILIAELTSNVNYSRAIYKHGDLFISKVDALVDYSVDKKNKIVTLTAKTYVQAVELEGEAIFEDNGFTIMAGETRKISYELLSNATSDNITVETYNLDILI